MRSLKTGDSTLVMERKTLDGAGEPHVHMLIGGGTAEFKNGSWESACDHLEVFDADFIASNVYSGDAITHEHKKNICRFVLGAEGVKLAVAYDSADASERAAAAALSAAKTDLQKIIARGMVIDTFIGLVEDPEVDKRIADIESEIAVIKDSTTIHTKGSLAKMSIGERGQLTPAYRAEADFQSKRLSRHRAPFRLADRRLLDFPHDMRLSVHSG